ncbi:hypothetical protein QT196_38805 (plasmid) [Streptomyces sp. P9-2B-2]|uniref:hypothetical protein n=1 Tax=Streptomyces sp. P9-2B-2 TaxID=3057114 RepID=UPI0025B5A364|nr:hypothetical protein [Streptomyces sp. P9-2B-2]WJY43214.1 hypothetical protein QT196_38805 [Streptomyces sp. P9-2B-2]
MFLIIRRPQLRQQLRRLYRSIHELHDRSVAEKRRADIAAQEVEQLQLAVNVFRRQSIEIQARISRLDIRESAEAWDLGAHIIALLDGPVPPGPAPRFCPSCQIADVEDYDLPIPHTDDSAPCARCRRCGHNWALDPAADGCCVACGGSGNLGRQGLDDPPCPCCEDHTPYEGTPAAPSTYIAPPAKHLRAAEPPF